MSIVRGSQSSSVAATIRELGEERDGEQVRAHVLELRADVDVQALDVESGAERRADGLDRVVLVEPELRAAVAGADRLVRLCLDARRDADEHAANAGGGSPFGLVERVEDDERAGVGGGAQLLVRLVVAVHEQPLAVDPRRPRERELAEGRDVGAESLLREQPQQRDVRERLRPIDDEGLRNGPLEHPRALPERVLGIDDERRAELLREVRDRHPVELQHSCRDPGAAREQC